MLIETLLLALLPLEILGFGKTVVIGGFFEENELLRKAFELSTRALNEDRHGNDELPDQFIESVLKIVANDSFDISRDVCDLADSGVAALFGPQNKITARHVQTMCDTLEIPHIAARLDVQQSRGNGLVNMYPYSQTLSMVYLRLAEDYDWKTYTILYENNEGLIRMHLLLKKWDRRGSTVTVRQLPEGPNYRPVLRTIKSSGDFNIILDCSAEILSEVLKQSQQIGIMSDRHNFIIASLDLQTIDLEPYQYGGTNLTGFRLINPEDPFVVEMFARDELDWGLESISQLTVEAALVYDGVQTFGRALKQLDDAIVADVETSLCENSESWEHGSSLMNFMRSTEMRGLTGLIKFDPAGYRSNFELDVVSLTDEGLVKIGMWNTSNGIEYLPKINPLSDSADISLRNRTFRVLISLTPPYGMLKESATMETGNDRFEGFGIDIIQELSKQLGFNYTFEVQTDNVYGSKDPVTGQWNGMVKKIMEDNADLAICDLTITADRQEAVDFTMPFMNLGISILFTKPLPVGSSLLSFLMPFSYGVWYSLMVAYTFVSLIIFIVGRLCPTEWNNPYPCIEEPEELENQFTLKNSLWFTIGAIMQQGSEIAPIGLSTRMAASAWWFFCMIMGACYTANLAACLVVESKQVLIKNVEDLANNQHGIKYGAKASGSTIDFFKASTNPTYKKMYDYMVENKDEVLMGSNDLGVAKVVSDKYAFFMESSTIAYEAERKCDLMMLGSLLDSKGYGIAMKKFSPYRSALSATILTLQETGVLKDLESKWWTQKRGGGRCAEKKGGTSDAKALGTDNVGGVFLVLIIGIVLSCVFSAWELLWEVGCTTIKEGVPFKEEIKEELKFIVKCSASSKPVRRRKQSSNRTNGEEDEDSGRECSPPYGLVPTVITTHPE
ncbi:glutamate receptor ionotropic, kainate 2-like [Athalia rosae]|uniref:glutamate receptor ionotropic, kainate 2-like n=1 Tax=Athalia rosae TaxID=37344 RepID=UPI00203378B5|nr:glutamate receptor ionotropic, kainate 2-like [Athalia rosae]XP_048512590.1 glutamate receptor ionotropic, kainate 2-like [Athalia rosae]